jgi:hypothetical protein
MMPESEPRIPVIRQPKRTWSLLLSFGLAIVLQVIPAFAPRDLLALSIDTQVVTRDGQHDFDFEMGAWKASLSRLEKPLAGSTTWLDYEGTSVVRKVWDGRANLGELAVRGTTGQIEGLSLRLYNPQTRQWHISWASARDGMLGDPMSGAFKDGRGEFFGEELFNGRVILVRFVFSDIASSSFRFEQAFSDDWGKTWEVNWKATFVRDAPQKPAAPTPSPEAAAAAAQAPIPPAPTPDSTLGPPARPADVGSPDAILKAHYDQISGPAGPRDWNRYRSLMAPHARIIPSLPRSDGGPGITVLGVEDYIRRATPIVNSDGFFVVEVSRKTEAFGNIVHAFSTYEVRRTAAPSEKPFTRGINSFQLVNNGNRWWIVSIAWDGERPGNEIPQKYLP